MGRSLAALTSAALVMGAWAVTPRVSRACSPDPRLETVAIDVALGDVEASPRALLEAVASAGSSAVEAHLLEEPSERALEEALARLEARIGLPLRCGRAEMEGGAVVAVASPDVADLVRAPGVVRGRLRAGVGSAHLVYRDAEGRIERIAVEPRELARGVRLRPSVPWRTVEVQLVAETRGGPRPVARLPGPLPSAETPMASGDPRAAVREARGLVGAPPLRGNALLEREATEHARLVCAAARASHRGVFGDPAERLRTRGIEARVVGEAVARAQSVPSAVTAMLASPSHRAAIEDARFTDVGVGVVSAGRTRCLVVLLAAFPRAVPPARPPNEVARFPRGRSVR